MSIRIVWSAVADRERRKLDPPIQRRVVEAVRRYAETGHGDVRRLAGVSPPELRLRIGDWRVRLARIETDATLVVLHVRHRGEAYR